MVLLSVILLGLSFFINDIASVTVVIVPIIAIPFSASVFYSFFSKKAKSLQRRKAELGYRDTPKIFVYLFVIFFSAFVFFTVMKLNGTAYSLILLALSVGQAGYWYPFCWGRNTWIYRGDK